MALGKFDTNGLVDLWFDMEEYKKVVFNQLVNATERAGRAWLNAIIQNTPIPSWSGASRATFLKLAQELGTTVPISIAPGAPNRIAMGKSAGAASEVYKDKQEWKVGIYYKSTLGHLNYNEYNMAVAGKAYPQPWSNNVRYTPYFFQQRGQTAWKAEAEKVELPSPWRYIKPRKLI